MRRLMPSNSDFVGIASQPYPVIVVASFRGWSVAEGENLDICLAVKNSVAGTSRNSPHLPLSHLLPVNFNPVFNFTLVRVPWVQIWQLRERMFGLLDSDNNIYVRLVTEQELFQADCRKLVDVLIYFFASLES